MYANARLSKPRKQQPTPRSAIDNFHVGTLRPSLSTFSPNSPLPRHQLASRRLAHSSMKAASLPHTTEIFQLNPALVPFSSLRPSHHAPPSSATPYTPSPLESPTPPSAGTVLALSKHKPVAEHVGASHHQYPATVVGDTLLRQQAILTINSLPTLISRLKADIADIANAAKPRQTPPKQEDQDDEQPPAFFDAAGDEDDLPLPTLKEKITKATAKPKATYAASAAGKRS